MTTVNVRQLAAMGIHYFYYPLESMLDAQAAAGYATLELWGGAPHFLLDHSGCQDVGPVRKMIEERGMNVAVFTPECASYHYLLASPDAGFRKRSMEYFKYGIRAAHEFGAEVMLVNCIGGVLDDAPETTFARAVEGLKELASTARECGVTLAVETVRPEESAVVTTLPELQRLLREVDHPNVKAALDTCAMGVAGETPRQWFEALGKDIVHCHFVDGRPYGHLVWGDGLYPLDRYLGVLGEFGYQGCLGQEITDFRYFDDPAEADRRNFQAFRPFLT